MLKVDVVMTRATPKNKPKKYSLKVIRGIKWNTKNYLIQKKAGEAKQRMDGTNSKQGTRLFTQIPPHPRSC